MRALMPDVFETPRSADRWRRKTYHNQLEGLGIWDMEKTHKFDATIFIGRGKRRVPIKVWVDARRSGRQERDSAGRGLLNLLPNGSKLK